MKRRNWKFSVFFRSVVICPSVSSTCVCNKHKRSHSLQAVIYTSLLLARTGVFCCRWGLFHANFSGTLSHFSPELPLIFRPFPTPKKIMWTRMALKRRLWKIIWRCFQRDSRNFSLKPPSIFGIIPHPHQESQVPKHMLWNIPLSHHKYWLADMSSTHIYKEIEIFVVHLHCKRAPQRWWPVTFTNFGADRVRSPQSAFESKHSFFLYNSMNSENENHSQSLCWRFIIHNFYKNRHVSQFAFIFFTLFIFFSSNQ